MKRFSESQLTRENFEVEESNAQDDESLIKDSSSKASNIQDRVIKKPFSKRKNDDSQSVGIFSSNTSSGAPTEKKNPFAGFTFDSTAAGGTTNTAFSSVPKFTFGATPAEPTSAPAPAAGGKSVPSFAFTSSSNAAPTPVPMPTPPPPLAPKSTFTAFSTPAAPISSSTTTNVNDTTPTKQTSSIAFKSVSFEPKSVEKIEIKPQIKVAETPKDAGKEYLMKLGALNQSFITALDSSGILSILKETYASEKTFLNLTPLCKAYIDYVSGLKKSSEADAMSIDVTEPKKLNPSAQSFMFGSKPENKPTATVVETENKTKFDFGTPGKTENDQPASVPKPETKKEIPEIKMEEKKPEASFAFSNKSEVKPFAQTPSKIEENKPETSSSFSFSFGASAQEKKTEPSKTNSSSSFTLGVSTPAAAPPPTASTAISFGSSAPPSAEKPTFTFGAPSGAFGSGSFGLSASGNAENKSSIFSTPSAFSFASTPVRAPPASGVNEEEEGDGDDDAQEEQEQLTDEQREKLKTGAGEEDETSTCEVFCKLYRQPKQPGEQLKDLGKNTLKVNKSTDGSSRILARLEGTGQITLNVRITKITQAVVVGPKLKDVTVIVAEIQNDGSPGISQYAVRCKDSESANSLAAAIKAAVPK